MLSSETQSLGTRSTSTSGTTLVSALSEEATRFVWERMVSLVYAIAWMRKHTIRWPRSGAKVNEPYNLPLSDPDGIASSL